ncbi:MAG: EAL domain-containing protein [Actinomycetales bacterium]|nr:EAL domain-containing protein [Actinomycetales bacterium]
MRTGPTIGVLSTFFGGSYFGGVLDGIAHAVAAVDGRIIGIQTLDAGTFAVDLGSPPPFRHRVAWEHVSGFVVLLNAVDREYLTTARESGRPIVMISDNLSGFDCPLVMPDNRSGIREAVDHLVEHGHRRIAFAGYPVQKDISDRYAAYQASLLANGISPDPALFFDTGNNQQSGGELAGRAMLAAGLPSTAVITGNDLNAIGLLRVLTDAGCEVPRDQAVIGFDDSDLAAFVTPSLSSVRQPLDEIGGRAVDLLLRQLDGEEVASGPHCAETVLVTRESCGCAEMSLTAPAAPRSSVESRASLLARLSRILEPERSGIETDRHLARLAAGAHAVDNAITAALDGGPAPDVARLRRDLEPLSRLLGHPERLVMTLRSVRELARSRATARTGSGTAADDLAMVHRVEDCLQQITLTLSRAQTLHQFDSGTSFFSTLSTQYAVSMDLLRSHERDPRSLTWLRRTGARAGCLGLWPSQHPDASAVLDIVGSFDRETPEPAHRSRRVSVESFPPADLVALADLENDHMLYVSPLKVDESDWGMLAVVAPLEAEVLTGRETVNQWGALLAVALQHEAVLESLREQEERLHRAALYDNLTGLPNRSLFQDRLEHAIRRAERHPDQQFAVLLLDLDGFKLVNDSLGHLAGDRLLQLVADRISGDLRRLDTAARFGGDEFAVLLEDLGDHGNPAEIAERLQVTLRTPYDLGGQEVVISASIGITLSSGGYHETEHVIRDADVAMYWAKSREKGTHAIFSQSMHTSAVDRLRIEGELRRAVEASEFELHYQPIVRLDTGTVCAFEVLLRWRHPSRGLLLPVDFLDIAEEIGLMQPVGTWVLGRACRQTNTWKTSGDLPVSTAVSVNVSNRQFWHGRLADDVAACVEATGLAPGDLALEITEGVIMHDLRTARRLLDELHDMGVALHIDDFGTGYSSLEALHHLPLDGLKIDRSFVSRLGDDERSNELVRTILLMGQNLGLAVVAEGIETTQQAGHLREMGCEFGQGFLLSRPVPAEEFVTVARRPALVGSAVPRARDGHDR